MFDELIDVLADRISEQVCKHIDNRAAKAEASGPRDGIAGNAELYAKLRARIKEYGMDHEYLAKKLKMSSATLSRRMTEKRPWLITEIYTVKEILQLPKDRLHEYFPKDGKI